MRWMTLSFAALALGISAPAQADDASDIRALEQQWGASFLSGDRAFSLGILAPEFRLMRAEGGKVLMTPRDRWFAMLENYTMHSFEARVTDVTVAGNTAVATVEGGWKVSYPGRGTREETFILSDTWVKRDGRWQVVYRHSTPFGTRTTPEPAAK
jgi:ketosteroid isomerase-like protein